MLLDIHDTRDFARDILVQEKGEEEQEWKTTERLTVLGEEKQKQDIVGRGFDISMPLNT